MSSRTLSVTDSVYEYLLRATVHEPDPLPRLREETARLPNAQMQISPEQGQLMRLLVELTGARRAVEVGVFTGYSSLCTAMAMPDDGRLVACDVSEEYTSVARRYWKEAGVDHKIDLRLGPAVETLEALVAAGGAASFDFAFIDADKSNYGAYYEACISLLAPGGLVAVDNTLWSGRVADPSDHEASTEAIRALNARIASDERVTMCLVPIGDGLMLARKR